MDYQVEVTLDSEKKNAVKYIGEGHTMYLLKSFLRDAFGQQWPKRVTVTVTLPSKAEEK